MVDEITAFTVPEAELAERIGVSRSVLQKKRREILTEGEDFGRVGNSVAFTSGAAKRLSDELGAGEKIAPLSEATRGLPAVSEKNRALAEVCRRFQPNTRAMECRLVETGEFVVVSIRDNRMFNVGQIIPVSQSQTSIYFLDAPQPRRNGHVPGFEEPKK